MCGSLLAWTSPCVLLSLPIACVCLSPGLISAPFSLLLTACCCADLILHVFRLPWPHLVSMSVGPELTFLVAKLCAGSWRGRENHQQPGNTENSPNSSTVIKNNSNTFALACISSIIYLGCVMGWREEIIVCDTYWDFPSRPHLPSTWREDFLKRNTPVRMLYMI